MDWMNSNWFWWALALALMALEALLPGTFMLWLGFAAAGAGLVHLVMPGLGLTGQWIVFALLSLIAVGLGWQYRRTHPLTTSDKPQLNRRGEQIVGRVLTLESAIENGFGRARVDDTMWAVTGPELPSGMRVRVVEADGTRLRVVEAE